MGTSMRRAGGYVCGSVLILACFGPFELIPAAGAQQVWVRQFGTPKTDRVWATAPIGESGGGGGAGGIAVAGWTYGELGGPNAGGKDFFVARYSAMGDPIWMRQFGTAAHEEARALARQHGLPDVEARLARRQAMRANAESRFEDYRTWLFKSKQLFIEARDFTSAARTWTLAAGVRQF